MFDGVECCSTGHVVLAPALVRELLPVPLLTSDLASDQQRRWERTHAPASELVWWPAALAKDQPRAAPGLFLRVFKHQQNLVKESLREWLDSSAKAWLEAQREGERRSHDVLRPS